jgi:hypothetical protein
MSIQYSSAIEELAALISPVDAIHRHNFSGSSITSVAGGLNKAAVHCLMPFGGYHGSTIVRGIK